MTGTDGDDSLTISGGAANFVGAGFEFNAKNFASVRANGGLGSDSAKLSDVKALTASDGSLVATLANGSVAAFGFESIEAAGSAASKANLIGTKGDETVVTDSTGTTTTFESGATIKTSGFASETFDGRGGNDSAAITAGAGANVFEGFAQSATFTNGANTRAFNGFSNVKVFGSETEAKSSLVATLHNTAREDVFTAFDDVVEMDVDGDNLYTIVAADQVAVKRDFADADKFEVADDLDVDFTADDWTL